MYSQNIYGSIYIDNINEIEILKEEEFHLISWIQNNILEVLERLLPKEQLGILLGMMIGDTSYISEEIKLAFQNSGITHLLAVSGSNVTYVILVTKFLFQKIVGKSFSNGITIFMIILFVLISGASPSVVRAGLMAILLILSEILARAPNIYSTVATTAFIILLFNPFILCDVGFILSFGGTLGILFFNQVIQEKINQTFPSLIDKPILKSFVDMLSVTLAAQIFLVPIMCFYFNQISFISIITNLIVGPFTGIITVLGITMYFLGNIYFPIAQILSYSMYYLISFLIFISNLCSNVPYGNILVSTPSILEIILYYFVLYQVFSKKENRSKKHTAYIKILIILLSIIEAFVLILPASDLKLNMIDVGQGDSILIQTIHGKNILVDGGGSENSDYDVGEKVLVPYLLDQTNGVIDCMIISHFHEDHVEGCISVLEKLKVKQIIIGIQPKMTNLYQEVLKIAKEKQIPIITLVTGDCFSIDGLVIEVLYPNKNLEILEDLNNNSVVLKMTYGEVSILISGDIEKEAEEKILDKNIDVDILKVAHHGSKTSSINEFLERVRPKLALISVGEDNKFGHPNDEVLKRLEDKNIKIFRTDEMGEIILKINKNGIIKIKTKL